MSTFRLRTSLPHWISLVVWLALGFTASAWVLRAQGASAVASAQFSTNLQRQDPDSAAVAKALGAMPASAAKPSAVATAPDISRFTLVGVIDQSGGKGAALVAVDGKPAKPVAVGAVLTEGWVLSKVERQSAWMSPEKGPGESLQLRLVPPESKKPLSVGGVVPSTTTPLAATEAPRPATTQPPQTPPPGAIQPMTKPAFGAAMLEAARNTPAEGSAPGPSRGN